VAGINEGRIAIVTGAGRGIGRGHALELARHGAKVVVNDLGAEVDGDGVPRKVPPVMSSTSSAAHGGQAVANGDDVSDWDGAGRLVHTAVDTFGGLDILVNNAGIMRDRMLVNMSIDEWDAVIRVHLRGTFATVRWASEYWRERAKQGRTNDARIINTTSAAGMYGNVGQANYGAAKAGIAGFTLIAATELASYGVTVNAINPGARTRMTEQATARIVRTGPSPGQFDFSDPENIRATRRVAVEPSRRPCHGSGVLRRAAGRSAWPRAGTPARAEKDERWDPAELGPVVTISWPGRSECGPQRSDPVALSGRRAAVGTTAGEASGRALPIVGLRTWLNGFFASKLGSRGSPRPARRWRSAASRWYRPRSTRRAH
jgi:NAD(P)-dependent dehydrogenase (short-subunit alcohol dehydrogenase family)